MTEYFFKIIVIGDMGVGTFNNAGSLCDWPRALFGCFLLAAFSSGWPVFSRLKIYCAFLHIQENRPLSDDMYITCIRKLTSQRYVCIDIVTFCWEMCLFIIHVIFSPLTRHVGRSWLCAKSNEMERRDNNTFTIVGYRRKYQCVLTICDIRTANINETLVVNWQ